MQDQSSPRKNGRVVAIIVIIILILAGLGAYSYHKKKSSASVQSTAPATTQQNPNTTALPSPKTISPFTLTDDTGKPFTNDNLKGHWTFMFFGFTHCGDVCPTTLTELNKTYQQLQKDLPADQLPQVVFVSVDPDRDTVDVLHNYIKNYNPNFIAATGNADNLNVFVKDLGVYFAKVPSQDANNYGVHHSSQLYLLNPDGNWVDIFTYPIQADQLAKNYEGAAHA